MDALLVQKIFRLINPSVGLMGGENQIVIWLSCHLNATTYFVFMINRQISTIGFSIQHRDT